MKKFEHLGKVLSKAEQKWIKGGFQFACNGVGSYFYTGPDFCCIMDCPLVRDGVCDCYCEEGTETPQPCGYA